MSKFKERLDKAVALGLPRYDAGLMLAERDGLQEKVTALAKALREFMTAPPGTVVAYQNAVNALRQAGEAP